METLLRIGSFLLKLIVSIVYLCLAATYGNLETVFIVLFLIGLVISSIAVDFMGEYSGFVRVAIFGVGFAFVIIPAFVQNITVLGQATNYYKESFFLLCATLMFIEWFNCGDSDFPCVVADGMAIGGVLLYSLIAKFLFYSWNAAVMFFIAGIVVLVIMVALFFKDGPHLLW